MLAKTNIKDHANTSDNTTHSTKHFIEYANVCQFSSSVRACFLHLKKLFSIYLIVLEFL